MSTVVRRTLIVAIALLVLVLVYGQIMVSLVASDVGKTFPEVAHLVVPYSIGGITALACFQVAAVILCVIVSRSAGASFFTQLTQRLIVTAGILCVMGFLIPAGVATHLLFVVSVGGPGVLIGWLASLIATVGFGCITYIARKAFNQAHAEHEELGAVI